MLAGRPLTSAQLERLCKWYFCAGFVGLPWLWFATWLIFRHRATENPLVMWYTTASLRLSIAGMLLLLLWYVSALLLLPAESSLFVIPPFTGKWQPGLFAML